MGVLEDLAAELGLSADQLRMQLATPDASQAQFITVDATGAIGANFTGHIHAQGVDFDEPTLANPAGEVRWIRPSDGQVGAWVGAKDQNITGPTAGPILQAQVNKVGNPAAGAQNLLQVTDDAGNSSYLLVSQGPIVGGSGVSVQAWPNVTATVLDQNGRSSYLQLAALAQRAVDLGTATITWPGGSPNSNAVVVNHGLGRVPTEVLLTPSDSGTFRFSKLAAFTYTSTQFSIQAQTGDLSSPAAGASVGVAWQAVG